MPVLVQTVHGAGADDDDGALLLFDDENEELTQISPEFQSNVPKPKKAEHFTKGGAARCSGWAQQPTADYTYQLRRGPWSVGREASPLAKLISVREASEEHAEEAEPRQCEEQTQ